MNLHNLLTLLAHDKRWLTVSNVLTCLRILFAPAICVGVAYSYWRLTFVMFVVTAFTDILDGWVARLFHEDTHLGRLLDPLADKFFLLCCFGSLAFISTPSFSIPRWFFVIIFAREVIMVAGSALLLNFKGLHVQIQPTRWGKLTTFFQLLFIAWIFICHFCGWAPAKTYIVLLISLTLFSLVSLAHYIKVGFEIVFLDNEG